LELVESGRVRLSIGTHAGERVLGVAGPGDLFGERALIDSELRATDAVAAEDCELLSVRATDLLRFIESRPAVAERTLTLVRMRVRQESELTGEPEPSDVAARLLGSMQRLSAAEGRALPIYEILPLYLAGGSAWLMRPATRASIQVDAAPGALPADAVGASLAAAGLDADIVHSTSWRYERGRLVLTYLAVLPEPVEAAGFEAAPVTRAELARGTAKGAPTDIGVGQVVEHGLRHLSWLSKDDPIIRQALPAEWQELVEAYRPEPFRAL
jgi:CRP-like cAMP-binding protein